MIHTVPSHPSKNSIGEDEFSLSDIFQFFKDGRRWIISTTIICTFAGIAYAFLTPAKYEASANIEMASAAGAVVEAPSILAEKLKLPLYYSTDTFKACDAENKLPSPGEFLANQLKPMVNKQAPIVTIKFRSESALQAKTCLEAVLADVKRNQGILSKPILDAKNSQLQAMMHQLEGTEKLLSALLPVGQVKFDFSDPKFSASALLLATSVAKENEIKDLRNRISELQISLTSPQTRDTSIVTPIYAPNIKVEPKKTTIISSAAIAGILLGILILAMRRVLFIRPATKNESLRADGV
jgi:LPS O-antigen subunit length determinant protein (WzzB/FepE family)